MIAFLAFVLIAVYFVLYTYQLFQPKKMLKPKEQLLYKSYYKNKPLKDIFKVKINRKNHLTSTIPL